MKKRLIVTNNHNLINWVKGQNKTMENIIKRLVKAVEKSTATLQKVQPQWRYRRDFDEDNGTSIIIQFNFCNSKLDRVRVRFRWEGQYQFKVVFAKELDGGWHKYIEFWNDFCNLQQESQYERLEYFLDKYPKFVHDIQKGR